MLKTLNETAGRKRFAKCDPAWLRMDLSGRELRVLLALSLHADWRPNGFGRCYPKRDTLALTTRLQISHISEAVRALAEEHRLITVVRLGRKNIYFVRPVGDEKPMPPSNAVPFFRHLGERGYLLTVGGTGQLAYREGSRNLADEPLLMSICSDYARGLTFDRLAEAVDANMKAHRVPNEVAGQADQPWSQLQDHHQKEEAIVSA